jgi:hypothetical protein
MRFRCGMLAQEVRLKEEIVLEIVREEMFLTNVMNS